MRYCEWAETLGHSRNKNNWTIHELVHSYAQFGALESASAENGKFGASVELEWVNYTVGLKIKRIRVGNLVGTTARFCQMIRLLSVNVKN